MSPKTFYIVLERGDYNKWFESPGAAANNAKASAASAGPGYEYVVLKAISRHKAEKPLVASEELE